MLPNLPLNVFVLFIATTFATLALFYWVLKNRTSNNPNSNLITGGIIAWLGLQAFLGKSLFYTKNLDQLPPRIAMLALPLLILTIILFTTKKGKAFIDSLPLLQITWLNIIRIPVEVGLYWLAIGKAVPELMTFAGRNFDIIGGLTAPFVAYFGIQKGMMSRNALLVWNMVMLGFLLQIIVSAIGSVPSPLQQFGFEQPNVAILHFPYNWLASFMAPLVLFGHLVSIRQLWKRKE